MSITLSLRNPGARAAPATAGTVDSTKSVCLVGAGGVVAKVGNEIRQAPKELEEYLTYLATGPANFDGYVLAADRWDWTLAALLVCARQYAPAGRGLTEMDVKAIAADPGTAPIVPQVKKLHDWLLELIADTRAVDARLAPFNGIERARQADGTMRRGFWVTANVLAAVPTTVAEFDALLPSLFAAKQQAVEQAKQRAANYNARAGVINTRKPTLPPNDPALVAGTAA